MKSLTSQLTSLAFLIGAVAGFVAAALGGWVDQVLGRVVDVLMAIPSLIFGLLILTIVGTSIPVLIVVIAVLDSTRVFRLSRAVGMNIVVMDYVEVARLRGEGVWWVISKEVLRRSGRRSGQPDRHRGHLRDTYKDKSISIFI